MNTLRNMFRGYQHILKTYPVTTQSIQTGVLMGVGDVIAQTFVENKRLSDVDTIRMARFAAIGFVFVGPVLRKWYLIMDQRVGHKDGVAVIKKVALDQLMFAPVFLACLLPSIGILAGDSLDKVKDHTLATYPDVLITNYKVWPFVQLCNFYVVPLSYQVLVAQIVALFWNTYISWKANQPTEGSGTAEIRKKEILCS